MVTHALSRIQVRAVHEVMRLFAEDDQARGVARDSRQACACCRTDRPAAGFIHYREAGLCNACATAFELARLRRDAPSLHDFLDGAWSIANRKARVRN